MAQQQPPAAAQPAQQQPPAAAQPAQWECTQRIFFKGLLYHEGDTLIAPVESGIPETHFKRA
jgi:hypothetical protein